MTNNDGLDHYTGKRSHPAHAGLRRVLVNTRTLVSGKAASAALSLAYIALATTQLGAESFGVLVVLQAYALAVASLVQFGGAPAIQRYGSLALEARDERRLSDLLSLAVLLGLVQLILVPLAVAGSAPLLAESVGASRHHVGLMVLFAVAAPFEKSTLPASLLRLLDRYKSIATLLVVSPALRLVGAGMIVVTNGGLAEFAYVWAGSWIVHGCLVWGFAWRETRQWGIAPWLLTNLSVAELFNRHPGLFKFAAFSSLSEMLRSVTAHLTTLFAGGLIGAEGAGYLNIAQRLTNIVGKLPGLLRQTMTPELSKLSARREINLLSGVMLRVAGLALILGGPIVALYVFAGRFMISLFAGPEFLPAYGVLIALIINRILRLVASPLDPAITALGMAGHNLTALGLSVAVYLVALWSLAQTAGVLGLGLSLILFTGVYYSLLGAMVFGEVRMQMRGPNGAPVPPSLNT